MTPLIIIPALNESATIGSVIDRTRQQGWNHILVVDDCSHDDTEKTAIAHGAEVICLPINLGAWAAIQTGILYALANGYSNVLTMDADNQHDPADLTELFKALSNNQNDVVIGTCLNRGSVAKRFIWYVFKKLSGLDVKDLTSGFRAYNKKAMELMLTQESQILDYQDIGVLLLCKRNNLRIAEIQVQMNQRTNGQSRIYRNYGIIIKYLVSTLCLIGIKRW
jgi:hypothetical protein